MMEAFFRTVRQIAYGLIQWFPTPLQRWAARLTARTPPPYINSAFVRPAECMNTSAPEPPPAVMGK